MKGSRCPRGHGAWWPARVRCPACGGAVEEAVLPDRGRVLAASGPVAVVALGEAVAPARAEGDLVPGLDVRLDVDADGLLRARSR